MTFLSDISNTFGRFLRSEIRTPQIVIFSLAQPLFWLLLFGQLFEKMVNVPGISTSNYISFLAPGVMVMIVLYSSTYGGMSIVDDISSGLLDKFLVTPANRTAFVIGSLLASLVSLSAQILVVFGAASLMGLEMETGIAGVFLTMFFVGLLSFGIAGLSKALALATKNAQPVVIIGSFVTMPLIFLSGALMPLETAPDWIQTAAKFNPIEYTVKAVRYLVIGNGSLNDFIPSILVLTAFAVFGVAIATLAFRKATN